MSTLFQATIRFSRMNHIFTPPARVPRPDGPRRPGCRPTARWRPAGLDRPSRKPSLCVPRPSDLLHAVSSRALSADPAAKAEILSPLRPAHRGRSLRRVSTPLPRHAGDDLAATTICRSCAWLSRWCGRMVRRLEPESAFRSCHANLACKMFHVKHLHAVFQNLQAQSFCHDVQLFHVKQLRVPSIFKLFHVKQFAPFLRNHAPPAKHH